MIDGKARQAFGTLHEAEHGFRDIGQIGPLVGGAFTAGIGNRRHRFSGLYQPLRKPVVGGSRAEEVSCPNDDDADACLGRALQATLHLLADQALVGVRVLRGVLGQNGKGIPAEIIDRSRQEDARA
ncbi:hypothetical protein D9M72_569510 [compost metagenome]